MTGLGLNAASLGIIGAAAASGVDLTPILVALIAGIASAGGGAWLTQRATNRRLDAEGTKLTQDALKAAEERGQAAVATVDGIRRILEERLERAEQELERTRAALDLTEEKLRRIEADARLIAAERDKVIAHAEAERERLQARIADLERNVADLMAQGAAGRRHGDPS